MKYSYRNFNEKKTKKIYKKKIMHKKLIFKKKHDIEVHSEPP